MATTSSHGTTRRGRIRGAAPRWCCARHSSENSSERLPCLAEACRAACRSGFDVLRFDYEGTGDSAGDLTEPDRVDAWLRNIERVVDEARELAGSSEVALVGLRIGASAGASGGSRDRWRRSSGAVESLPVRPSLRSRAQGLCATEPQRTTSPGRSMAPTSSLPAMCSRGRSPRRSKRLNLDTLPIAPAPHVLLVEHDDRPPIPRSESAWRDSDPASHRVRPAGHGRDARPWPVVRGSR